MRKLQQNSTHPSSENYMMISGQFQAPAALPPQCPLDR